MKNNQDIGSALKSKLENLHDSPDDFVWDAIEEKLKKKKRRLLFWYFTFGLGILLLGIFIVNPFNAFTKGDINDLKLKEQNIKIVEQNNHLNASPHTNLEDKKSSQHTNSNLNTKKELPNDNVSSTIDSTTKHNESLLSKINSKNLPSNKMSSEKQKLANSVLYNKVQHKTSQTDGSIISDSKKSNIANKNDTSNPIKSTQSITQTKEQRNLLEINKEKAIDSLLKIEDEVVEISEEKENIEHPIDDNEKVKDSLTESEMRWSINLQLIQSNYGAFNIETSNISSTNYGLLLGKRITNKTFLRFGIRKLDLMQTINNTTNRVSYLEFPLEVKYLFRDKNFNPYLTGGLSYFMLGNQGSENSPNLEYASTMSLNFGLGLEHKLFDRLYINIESNFNYQIKPITSNIEYTPYIFSIHTGIDYRF